MLEDDGDIIRGLGFVCLHSAHAEEQIDSLITMLCVRQGITGKELRWPTSRKIRHTRKLLRLLDFQGKDELMQALRYVAKAFNDRNEVVHGTIYSHFDRRESLTSGRPNVPERTITSAELYELAARFEALRLEIYRPMILKLPKLMDEQIRAAK
jgi:hypothetical protein